MRKLGTKQLSLDLHEPLAAIPGELQSYDLTLSPDRTQLIYTYDSNKEDNGIAELLAKLSAAHVRYKDLNTQKSSLEDIFVNLVKRV
jgi:ABC-2 type transport system ATP-binding protein